MSKEQRSLEASTDEDDTFVKSHYYSLEQVQPEPDKPPSKNRTKDSRGSCSGTSTVSLKIDKGYQSIHQGFLTKQGGAIKNWKKRFFTLRANNILYYYRDINKDPQGGVDLKEEGVKVRQGIAEEDTCYQGRVPFDRTIVVDTVGRKYYLYSETVGEADKWLEVLNVAVMPPLEQKKSCTLPAQMRSMTFGQTSIEKPTTPTAPLSPQFHRPKNDNKLRANTVSARFQALPAVPARTSRDSIDVEQFYGELPVHQRMLAEMRAKVKEEDINYYSGILDLHIVKDLKEAPINKRRSELYKCRSVEDFISTSRAEESELMVVKRSGIPSLPIESIYSTADREKIEDPLYGLTITIPGTKQTPTITPSKPKLSLPELTEYATTVQPIPAYMRKSMMPHMPTSVGGENKENKRVSKESLGIGVYSLLNPDNQSESDIPVPKPRHLPLEPNEGIYDDVPVEELYDEITACTRDELMEINQTSKSPEFKPHKKPDNDYDVLDMEAVVRGEEFVVDTSYYDEVAQNTDPFSSIGVKSNNLDLISDVTLSPRSTRRCKDPLPPVPAISNQSVPPPLPSSPKPILIPKAATLKPRPTFTIDTDDSGGDYMMSTPKKKSIIPDLSDPKPLDTKLDTVPLQGVKEDETSEKSSTYARVQRSATLDGKVSLGTELFNKNRERSGKDDTPIPPPPPPPTQSLSSSGSSSSEVDLAEEERKLERLKREFNREEKKSERIENEIKNQKKMDVIKKDQQKILDRIESIRAKNISLLIGTGQSTEEPKSPTKLVPLIIGPDLERLQIEKDKLELERDRHKLEREKLEIEKQKSEMERFKFEHQKLLFEREKLLFEKEKMELNMKKST